MATTAPSAPRPAAALRPETKPAAIAVPPAEEPLAALPAGELLRRLPPLTASVARLPVELDVSVRLKEFRVHDLLALEAGQVIESCWPQGDDLPLRAGDVQLAWCEFEVIASQLGVRITWIP